MVIYHDLPMNNGELPWFTNEKRWFLHDTWYFMGMLSSMENLQEPPHMDGKKHSGFL